MKINLKRLASTHVKNDCFPINDGLRKRHPFGPRVVTKGLEHTLTKEQRVRKDVVVWSHALYDRIRAELTDNAAFQSSLRDASTTKFVFCAHSAAFLLALKNPSYLIRPLIAALSDSVASRIVADKNLMRTATTIGIQAAIALVFPSVGPTQVVFALLDPTIRQISASVSRRNPCNSVEISAVIYETINVALSFGFTKAYQLFFPPRLYRYYDQHTVNGLYGHETVNALKKTVAPGEVVLLEGTKPVIDKSKLRFPLASVKPMEVEDRTSVAAEVLRSVNELTDEAIRTQGRWAEQSKVCEPLSKAIQKFVNVVMRERDQDMYSVIGTELDSGLFRAIHVVAGSCHSFDSDPHSVTASGDSKAHLNPECHTLGPNALALLRECVIRNILPKSWYSEYMIGDPPPP